MAGFLRPVRLQGSLSSSYNGLTAQLGRMSLAPSTSGRNLGLCVEGKYQCCKFTKAVLIFAESST